MNSPIGIFDSGYGGLTILSDIIKRLPQYDYIYLGDNARSPYGTRSFDIVYQYTLQAIKHLFDRGCRLIILACNTASAKALRNIQQIDLPEIDPERRVLGVIRPTVEALSSFTKSGDIGIFATPGTVASKSYEIEISKLYPSYRVFSQACPMWVPLVENNEMNNTGARYFIKRDVESLISKYPEIDTVILGCTHYPIIYDIIKSYLPENINIIKQGNIVTESLINYLSRHQEIEKKCSKGGHIEFLTTEDPDRFNKIASRFLNLEIDASKIILF